jgi:AhpD family alkylhydroperoxidase
MGARLNYPGTAIAANFGKHLNSAGKAVTDSSLPAATQDLVKIRASQINGCARRTDTHTNEAEHAALVSLVAVINACNRLGVTLRAPGGDYEPGQWG